MSRGPIYVARPMVPDGADYLSILTPALQHRRLTNGGALSAELELRLSELLRTRHVSLVGNGTVAIEIAAKALNFKKKVITTAFTFPATVGALQWIGLDPVLVDIEEDYLTIDPIAAERAIDDDVSGILGVHVYGCPCDLVAFGWISDQHNIPVLYDGAHIFDASYNGSPIVGFGSATTLSFHATKQFNTGEGGAIVTTSSEVNSRVSMLKNFGIESEELISDIGINGKMSELNAAFGLANLNLLFEERSRRASVAQIYTEELSNHPRIRIVPQRPETQGPNHYFAIRLPVENEVRIRDKAYLGLREKGIFSRKYFFPLISEISAYTRHMSQKIFDLPNATRASCEVLVLPLHGGISDEDALYITAALKESINE